MELESRKDLLKYCQKTGKSLAEVAIEYESHLFKRSKDALIADMKHVLTVMEESREKGGRWEGKTLGGMFSNEMKLLQKNLDNSTTLSGRLLTKVMVDALSIASYNACMGRIVAAPTAGSCGILPAALLNVRDELGLGIDETVHALFVADIIGYIIAQNATVSGAEGGCQSECGTAAAMTAGAIAALKGAEPEVMLNAAALALKNCLGLTCDPVATLVEVPCIKRNAFLAVHAIVAADLALAGIKSVIPFDDVIVALKDTASRMPPELKETSEGGLGITKTAKRIKRDLFA
ncbi:MAG: L-serine ammonia-lyase, iron-sulfur-dependent, subunit alpha [Candidatus Methanospirareceae archaeon]